MLIQRINATIFLFLYICVHFQLAWLESIWWMKGSTFKKIPPHKKLAIICMQQESLEYTKQTKRPNCTSYNTILVIFLKNNDDYNLMQIAQDFGI